MPFVYRSNPDLDCLDCCWFVAGKCTIPDEIYEYECPLYNDPEPIFVPAEV